MALEEIHPTLRGAREEMPFRADAATLRAGLNFTFNTDAGQLDLLGYVEPLGDFNRVNQRAVVIDFAGRPLRVIHIDDLIAVKRHIKRAKDSESLHQLLAIKRLIDEERDQSGGADPTPEPPRSR